MRFQTMTRPAFSRMMRMIPILRDLIILTDRKYFKNWQANTSEVDLDSYNGHTTEERIPGSKSYLDLYAKLINTRVYTVIYINYI